MVLSTQIPPITHKRFLGVEEFAALLGVTPKTIYRHAPNIPHVRIGNRIRFDMESPVLLDWMKSTSTATQQTTQKER